MSRGTQRRALSIFHRDDMKILIISFYRVGIELTAVVTFTRLYSCHCNNSLKKVEASWKRSRIAYECKRDGCGLILNSRKLTIFSSSLWHHKLLALSFVIFQPYLDFVWLNVLEFQNNSNNILCWIVHLSRKTIYNTSMVLVENTQIHSFQQRS